MPKVRWVLSYGFAANFMRFPAVHKNFESRLRFDKVTDMQFNGGNFFSETHCSSITDGYDKALRQLTRRCAPEHI